MSSELAPTEQNHPTRKLADAVAMLSKRVKRITKLVQIDGDFHAHVDEPGQMHLRTGERPANAWVDDSELKVLIGFLFEAKEQPFGADAKSDEDPDIRVRAGFEITYEMNFEDFVPTKEELIAFGEVNGRFNAMSYWREYVNSCLNRAGLPSYLIPPFDAGARLARLNSTGKSAPTKQPTKD